jgi:hypothetical protein
MHFLGLLLLFAPHLSLSRHGNGDDSSEIRLSIIATGRNDDYGGPFVPRLQAFLDNFCAHFSGTPTELVLTDYNPPGDRAPLSRAIRWPEECAPVSIITYPAALHAQWPNSEAFPLFEYRGKNAAIRRARGRWVLATNPDNLFSPELAKWLAQGLFEAKTAQPRAYYRAERVDVRFDVAWASAAPGWAEVRRRAECVHGHADQGACAALLRHSKRPLGREGKFEILGRGGGGYGKIALATVTETAVRDPIYYCRVEPDPGHEEELIALAEGLLRGQDQVTDSDELNCGAAHTMAAGDFLLMRKADFVAQQAYRELDTTSHCDSFGVYDAVRQGLSQVVLTLPKVLYQLNHDRSERFKRPGTPTDTFVEQCRPETRDSPLARIGSVSDWGAKNSKLRTVTRYEPDDEGEL